MAYDNTKSISPTKIALVLAGVTLVGLLSACGDQATPTPTGGVTVATAILPPAANPALSPEPELGIVIDTNFQVVEVRKGSAAEEAGLQPGDTIVSINDEKFEEPAEAFVAYRDYIHSKPGSGVPITIESARNGRKVIELEIVPSIPPQPSESAPNPTPTPLPDDWVYL